MSNNANSKESSNIIQCLMAINFEERNKIKDFVNNQKTLNISSVYTMGGPCANWVASIIEKATGRQILDKERVFNNNISKISKRKFINNYDTLSQSVNEGDILYVIDSHTGNTTHYMLFCEVVVQDQGQYVQKNCLGVNGGLCLNSLPYKEVIASEIKCTMFDKSGLFSYDPSVKNAKYHLYKVDFDLV